MLKDQYPYYLANKPVQANAELEVTDKYRGQVATRVALADAQALDQAIAAAEAATPAMAALKPYQRREVLEHCVNRFRARFDELAESLCIEAGKPIKDAEGEVTRLIETFRVAAAETERDIGAVVPLANAARAAAYEGMYKRVPIGPCAFISPFNFPLNLAAHKVAPAIAAGCPFVLKPASRTPIGALIIGETLAETDLPEGAFSILPMTRKAADALVEDDRLKLLSFTGSDTVGWALKARAGKKKVVMELGGNAACIIDETWDDLDDAVARLIIGAFYQSGQSCIGVQRVLIHRSRYEAVRDRFVEAASKLKAGDPSDRETFIGPMISEGEAERLHGWIQEAEAAGGRILCGGGRDGAMLQATLMENVDDDQKLVTEEAFGPAAVLSSFDDFDEALAAVNNSRFGLQAGVFTQDLYRMQRAWDHLDVGGVIIGDVPSWRTDQMPYGGVKDSGLGREGLRFAIDDMSEIRLLAIRTP